MTVIETPITAHRQHVCPEGDGCPVCVSNATTERTAAAMEADTLFQRLSRVVEDETPEERHWRIADTREQYEASHMIWGALKGRFHDLMPTGIDWSRVTVAFEKGLVVGRAYEAMTHNPFDPEVIAAYEALMEIIDLQYEFLVGVLGINVDYVDPAEPYDSATAQAIDVIENRHLSIATISIWEESYHPMLGNERGGSYDRFRAVHDAFGHVATGSGFDRHGEYVSWLFHAMLCGESGACAAISTELHGANSYLWTTGQVATFKAGLLPNDLRDPHRDCEQFGFKQAA